MARYSPVYSSQFILYNAETPNTSFLVPPGYTAVVRQISCWQDVGGYQFSCFITDDPDVEGINIVSLADIGANISQNEAGRWVVAENGLIGISITVVGSHPQAYVGGYLLRNVAA